MALVFPCSFGAVELRIRIAIGMGLIADRKLEKRVRIEAPLAPRRTIRLYTGATEHHTEYPPLPAPEPVAH